MLAALKKLNLLLFCMLAACTVQLAPGYDQALVDGLGQANTDALTLFAELEPGSEATAFDRYAPRYAGVIGRFDALRQQAAARPVPPLAKRLGRMALVSDVCRTGSDPADCVNASPASIGNLLITLRRMRDTHRKIGLDSDAVRLFRGSYDIAIAQALTVETALKR